MDAGVAAKWVLPPEGEPLADEALTILKAYSRGETAITVPDLFWPEAANILWRSARVGRISWQAARSALSAFEDLEMTTLPSRQIVGLALDISETLNHPVYDAIYIALAIETGRYLLTADERLVRKAGVSFPVRWLGAAW